MFNLILFGPPGSGKGTQSEKLISRYGLKHLSTGDLLRSEISQETALGLEAKKIMDKGQLVPDEVVIGMISSSLDANPEAKGFLFDGFPRTATQAEALDKLLELKKTSIGVMLALDVTEEELIRRLLKEIDELENTICELEDELYGLKEKIPNDVTKTKNQNQAMSSPHL